MTRPTTLEILQYYTMRDVVMELNLERRQIRARFQKGSLPSPTLINAHGVRLFDQIWMKAAKAIVSCERGQITPFELKAQLETLEVNLGNFTSIPVKPTRRSTERITTGSGRSSDVGRNNGLSGGSDIPEAIDR